MCVHIFYYLDEFETDWWLDPESVCYINGWISTSKEVYSRESQGSGHCLVLFNIFANDLNNLPNNIHKIWKESLYTEWQNKDRLGMNIIKVSDKIQHLNSKH